MNDPLKAVMIAITFFLWLGLQGCSQQALESDEDPLVDVSNALNEAADDINKDVLDKAADDINEDVLHEYDKDDHQPKAQTY